MILSISRLSLLANVLLAHISVTVSFLHRSNYRHRSSSSVLIFNNNNLLKVSLLPLPRHHTRYNINNNNQNYDIDSFLIFKSQKDDSISDVVTTPPIQEKNEGTNNEQHESKNHDNDEWILLTKDGAVKKKIIHICNDNNKKNNDDDDDDDNTTIPSDGSIVEVEYIGTLLGEKLWTVDDVIHNWLQQQQGFDTAISLHDLFRFHNIDGTKLLDTDNFFTEEFVTNSLQLTNKIQCKKLIMSAKRLSKQQDDYPIGTIFDSNSSSDTNTNTDGTTKKYFQFTVGAKKVIRAYEIVIPTMTLNEQCIVQCRSDYAYGSDGLRKRDGTVIVPPFATLQFEITLHSIQ